VDLGYRAQLSGWKYAYLQDVVSMSVLPETASAFRVQRERWGRGLIYSALKHARTMLAQRMPLMKRAHALAMMFSSLLLAAVYVAFLLTLPLNFLVDFDGPAVRWGALGFYVLVAVWALDNTFGARKGLRLEDRPRILRTLWETYLYVAMFLPMSWHYFAGGSRALFGVYGDFHRTPKGQGEGRGDEPPPVNRWLLWGEMFSFGYSVVAIVVALVKANYVLIPISLTACVGFGMMLYLSWQQRVGVKHR
jgi:cellulose synthase (UDP-forming)